MKILTFKSSRWRVVIFGTVLATFVSGCSYVPDAVNPVEWYKEARDWVAGDDRPVPSRTSEAKPVPGANNPFPNLNTVPNRPARSLAIERERMRNSLIADHAKAKYTDENLRRQTSAIALGNSPQPRVSAQKPSVQQPRPNLPAVNTQAPVSSGFSGVRTLPQVPKQTIAVVPHQPVAVSPPQTYTSSRQVGLNPGVSSINPSTGLSIPSQSVVATARQGEFVQAHPFSTRFPNTAGSLQGRLPPVAIILFENGSAKIRSRDRRMIKKVYKEYRKRGGRIHIIGHASSRTRNLDRARHQLVNFKISYARARAVARILKRLGVPPEGIVVSALADQQPSYFEVMPAGEDGNRRAEIFFEN